MIQQTRGRKTRQFTSEWRARAGQRAIIENIDVRRVNDNGMLTATSGSNPKVASVLEIVSGVVRSCSCPGGEFLDTCCKDAARYYLDVKLLDPEPEPLTPAAIVCFRCQGRQPPCPLCKGAGISPLST